VAEQGEKIETLTEELFTHETDEEAKAIRIIKKAAAQHGLDVAGGRIRRTSSRLCLGVEHGDYNGCQLFGVGTDRYIWLAFKPNDSGKIRMFSANYPEQGISEIDVGTVGPPVDGELIQEWDRFPKGCDYVLNREGFKLSRGFDAVVLGNIPGGGMSRSASLAINLVMTMLEVNNQTLPEADFKVVELAQKIENDYIGSPCGNLDQIMIYYSKAGMGTHYDPNTKTVNYVPLGMGAPDFSIAALDTGTERPGLEKSTYVVRKRECDQLAEILQANYGLKNPSEVRDDATYEGIMADLKAEHPNLCERLQYLYEAQDNFDAMLEAWRRGDVAKVGQLFRADGNGLRDQYSISGPELQTMCDLVRTVPGVFGERMLGGGDKGAAGAILLTSEVARLREAVGIGYPRAHPGFADKYAVHVVKVTDGVRVLDGLL